MKTLNASALFALALALAAPASAAVPEVLPYAGHLEEDGDVYAGNISAVFSLYDDEVAGAEVWTESFPSVPVVNGDFVVDLGANANNPLSSDVLDGRVLWLEVTVNGQTLTPRTPLFAAPYAVRASVADSLEGFIPEEHPTFDDLAAAGGAPVAWSNLTGVPAGIADGDDDTTYTAGAGLALTGTVFSLSDGAVTEAKLANGAVTAAKLADGSVTSAKIVDGSVGNAELANSAVTSPKLAANTVDSTKIVDGSVGNADLANNAVNGAKIEDGSVARADLANYVIDGSKIAVSVITRTHLKGAETGIYAGGLVCGWGLFNSSQCKSIVCSTSGGVKFYNCSGSCGATSPQQCSTTLIGYMLDDDSL